jgi:hypothetical protein
LKQSLLGAKMRKQIQKCPTLNLVQAQSGQYCIFL